MLLKTIIAFHNRVDYTKNKNGSWRAEFRGPVEVFVEEPSLERCRSRATDQLDEKLAA